MQEVEDAMKRLAHLTKAIVSTVIVSGTLVVLSASVNSAEGRKIPEAPSTAKARLQEAYGKLPLSFEANRGQTDPQVRFLSRAGGHTLFLAPTEAVLVLRSRKEVNRYSLNVNRAPHDPTAQPPDDSTAKRPNDSATQRTNDSTIEPHNDSTVLRMSFVGANPKTRVEGQEGLPGKANYFTGNDPTKWRTHVPTYAKAHYQDLYPGIDLIYYGNQRQLEHDFVVRPGADPSRIALSFQGADKVEVDAQGDLVLHTAAGAIRQRKPVIYQEVAGLRRDIAGGYLLKGKHTVGFNVDKYDPNRPLIIDPVLVYSTYLGGSTFDQGTGIAVDAAGNAYVTGGTNSSNFPTTAGAFQTTFAGGFVDAFVMKLNPTGTALVYSTYLGGSGSLESSGSEAVNGIAVDAAGNAYVTGGTNSSNFPTTAGAFQTTGGGISSDAFVTKLNPTGSALVYSTYLGGSRGDSGFGIAVDAAGNAYVTGDTDSTNFPTTVGAFQPGFAAGGDAFVTKLNPTGSALVYSTYLGGSAGASGIAVDALGNAYVTGIINSTTFPTTPGAFQRTFGDGTQDAFVTKLNPTGAALVYSTYLGGSRVDQGSGIAVDAAGNAYVTGITLSSDFPTTPGAFQTAFGGARGDAFVTKLNPTGSALVYSTYLGGSSDFVDGSGIAVDAVGNAYVTGFTDSTSFPTTADAFQTTFGGSREAFVTKLNPTGSALVYSTYLGGSGEDRGFGIAVDATGNFYVTGFTDSLNFPTTAGAFQPTPGGSGLPADAFVAKFAEINTPAGSNVLVQPVDLATGKTPVTLTFSTVTEGGVTGLVTRSAGPPPPTGFKLGNPLTYYDLATTASFTGFVTVCINYTGIAFDNEASLKLFHFEDPNWVDATVSLDTATHTICGSVTSLSPFAIVEPEIHIQPFAAFHARVEIAHERHENESGVKGAFTLGAGSNGIHPLTEDVTLQVGAFAATISKGSFRRHGHGTFKFEGDAGGARLEVEIRSRGGNRFEVKVEGKDAQVGPANPVTVRLAVGDDAGSTLARVKVDDD
jgi:hypothetical protein